MESRHKQRLPHCEKENDNSIKNEICRIAMEKLLHDYQCTSFAITIENKAHRDYFFEYLNQHCEIPKEFDLAPELYLRREIPALNRAMFYIGQVSLMEIAASLFGDTKIQFSKQPKQITVDLTAYFEKMMPKPFDRQEIENMKQQIATLESELEQLLKSQQHETKTDKKTTKLY